MKQGKDLKYELGEDFYEFLDLLPTKKIYLDTGIIHPGYNITQPKFKTANPEEILAEALREYDLTMTLTEVGHFRITSGVYNEFQGIVQHLKHVYRNAQRRAARALPDQEERLKQIVTTYAQIVGYYKHQANRLELILRDEPVNDRIKEILKKLINRFGLDTKTINEDGKTITLPASSETDIELALTTFQSAQDQPTGLASLDLDVAQVFALCSMMFFDKRSHFKGIIKTDPMYITAHYFHNGIDHHEDATTILKTVPAIPPDKEREFFAQLNEEFESRYTARTKSGRITIATVIEEPKLNP